MTDLKLLTVSLTKEGAHKIFYLLRDLSVSEVLKSSNNVLEGVNLDQGLVRNILSAEPDDTLPNIWQRAKDHGETTVKSLLFLAIVFSHYQLIAAFRMGSLGQGQGEISRNDVRNIKVFTNIRREAVKLGLADYSADSFCYNMMQMFENANLGELTEQLLRHKLLKAGWDGTNSTADEAVRNGFHEVLAVDEMTFRLWLDGNSVGINLPDPEKELIRKFNFSSGHKPAKEGKANRGLTAEPVEANLTHNMLQTKLFTYLSGEFGPENVGTEVPSGVGGNSIDVVMVAGEDTTFYEDRKSVV